MVSSTVIRGLAMVATMSNAMLMSKTYGNYPAQKNILSCIYEGIQVPIDAGLRIETRYFINTQQRPEAKAMIRSLFLSMQELSKGGNRPAGYPKTEFKKIAVIGAGLMGAGIAYVQAKAGIPTVLVDVSRRTPKRVRTIPVASSRKLCLAANRRRKRGMPCST